ncbi:MAG TPA: lipoprotein [Paenalcaligenes sp.]|nr:lipoprotein [Paenalcaligenes sp.]
MYSKQRLRLGIALLAMLTVLLATTGCGYKGPLTLPPQATNSSSATTHTA